jgi:hypothetical protein
VGLGLLYVYRFHRLSLVWSPGGVNSPRGPVEMNLRDARRGQGDF